MARNVILRLAFAAALFAPAALAAAPGPVDGRVRLNSIGFTPDAVKEATVAATATTFRVVRVLDDAVVLEGALGAEQRTAPGDTDEAVRLADFSALRASGEYQLEIVGVGRSAPFRVADDLWNEPLRLATRGFYLWRCGTAVAANWQGHAYRHDACHLEDGWLDYVGGGHVRADGTGGWHDAGDYNKYVVNAGVTVGLLFKAWEHFRDRIALLDLDLPESGNGTPDFLNELRWELDWLLKMQAADGRVYHKLSEREFTYWGVPEADPHQRYFVPWGTTATADFAAMMAMAARHFEEFDATYAARCLAAARAAWAVLLANPDNVSANQTGFSTGAYEANDAVHRLWAAAELWATTGEAAFLQDFESRAANRSFTWSGPGWSDVRDLGLATYLETVSPARNAALVQRLRTSVLSQAESVVQSVNGHAYGRGLGSANWYWGANGSVAAQTFILHVADRLQPDGRYRRAAEKSLGFLFGRNFHNRSYVTGLGHEPPLHPHDRRGASADGDAPWPGYLVGGGWPTGRSWLDVQADYEKNEIAINWNGALVYALAAFAQPQEPVPVYEWATFVAGQAGAHTPHFTAGGAPGFAATGLPSWAACDPATGTIGGTPPTDDPATPDNNEARANYSVTLRASRDGGVVETRVVNLMVAQPGGGIRIGNLSSRAFTGTGDNILIPGFGVAGSSPRPLLIRGVGPTLGAAPFNLGGVLANPTLALKRMVGSASEDVGFNDDWSSSPERAAIAALGAQLYAFSLQDPGADAALVPQIASGNYTAHIAGTAEGTGVSLAEVYDPAPVGSDGQLVNISARAVVGTGDQVLISGAVLLGGGSARVLVRAVGPGLSTYGVGSPLPDPVLTLHNGGGVLARNDDWDYAGADEIATVGASVFAFPLERGSHDAAMIATLVEGSFTFVVSSKAGESGVVLLELYLVP